MRYFKRISNIFIGAILMIFALSLIFFPKNSMNIIASVLNIAVYIYGFRLLWYYSRMARHMVGGKAILYMAIIVLDAGLFMTSSIVIGDYVVAAYLLILFAFSGFINILRAIEAKNNGSPRWKFKFITGVLNVLFAISLLVFGLILHDSDYLAVGFGISLVYSAAIRIVTAFRKTAIVYIQ